VPQDSARVYQVRATAGVSTPRVAASNFSNRDLAVTVPFTDVPIDTNTAVKATHITEMRRAANALCDHLGFARIYSASDTLYTSLAGQTIQAQHWSSLQTQINSMRTNAAIGVGTFSFSEVPAVGMPIRKLHIDELRNSVK
jgi:L-lactate utilization protein LutC